MRDRFGRPTLIVSDVHIGASEATDRVFLDFLRYAAREGAALVIDGDLFDVGPTHPRWTAPAHRAVLDVLEQVVREGLAVTFVGGNRDPVEWSGPAMARRGVRVYVDPVRMCIGSRWVLVAHGDGARHGADRPYGKPYPLLRNAVVISAARRLVSPAWLHDTLARRSPTRERAIRGARGESTGPKRRAPAIEAWAGAELAADPELALVVAGHSHLPAFAEVTPGRYYVNAGDWISHFTYVTVPADHGPPEVRYWPSRARVDWATLPDAEVPARLLDTDVHTSTGASVPSLLQHRGVWRLLLRGFASFGFVTWGFEALLLRMVPDVPPEPWAGVYRLVEALLWVGPVAAAVAIAERWPITHLRRQWRRVAGQVAIGLALGPAWGALAYTISPYLMPWWHPRGMWGVIAKEAKGALLGYGTTAVLAHVAVRVLTQRRRAVAAAEAVQREAEARLDLLRLELQPEAVLRTMDAIAATIPRDVAAANDALVLLAESLAAAMASTRAREVPLGEELANVATIVRLHSLTTDPQVTFAAEVDGAAREAAVPHRLVQSLVEDVLAAASEQRAGCAVSTYGALQGERLRIELVATVERDAMLQVYRRLSTGRAVEHTRERLRSLFGSGDDLAWRACAPAGCLVLVVDVPWRTALPHATAAS